jgi:hypothetical protein
MRGGSGRGGLRTEGGEEVGSRRLAVSGIEEKEDFQRSEDGVSDKRKI